MTGQKSVVRTLQEIADALGDASIVAVYLFGSFVTNPEKASDVDVIVVRDRARYLRKRDRLPAFTKELSSQFQARTGRALDQTRLWVSELEESRFLDTVTARKIWPRRWEPADWTPGSASFSKTNPSPSRRGTGGSR